MTFDPTVAAAVAGTPLAGDLPNDLRYRLPEWCVSIETPGRTWEGRTLHGFWVHLEWIAPLAVNVPDPAALTVTVRPVS
ncbi:hypothetical protein [uncultured Thiodictyon sp.]|uniref:hypothetical protein n=1 Tax=uncultured Thiodictyon sp. TaxID=1846217 RepID=UPI0025D77362|nr:hypothetical protein [uncultured Thiodictyon sp.]